MRYRSGSYSDMANLSPDERVIIANHPLDISSHHLQDPLRKIEQSYKPGSLSYDGAVDSLNSPPKGNIETPLYLAGS